MPKQKPQVCNPRKPLPLRRRRHLIYKVSPIESIRLREIANLERVSVSDYCREAITNALDTRRPFGAAYQRTEKMSMTIQVLLRDGEYIRLLELLSKPETIAKGILLSEWCRDAVAAKLNEDETFYTRDLAKISYRDRLIAAGFDPRTLGEEPRKPDLIITGSEADIVDFDPDAV